MKAYDGGHATMNHVEHFHGAHYDHLYLHRLMIKDGVRNRAYEAALAAAVRPGDAVLDVGSGTGILAVLAAKAGARKVYAVEPTWVARAAREIVQRSGYGNVVEVINAPIEEARLPEQVDVIVSEWMGALGNDENLFPVFLRARDAWLKPGGRMVPERVTTWMAPTEDAVLDAERAFWGSRPYGVDLTTLGAAFADEFRTASQHILEANLLAAPARVWDLDGYAAALAAIESPRSVTLSFTATRAGRVDGIAGWFDAALFGGTTLSCAPAAPPTHWGRMVLPLERPYPVAAGTAMEVRFTERPGGRGYAQGGYSFRLAGGAWEHHCDHRSTLPA